MSENIVTGIQPGLEEFLTPIDKLQHLPGNPRKGDVDAIVESYTKFKQVRPIVAVEEDGKLTVIAGNHQLMAAKALGWTHMAVIVVPFEGKEAVAFALADNRTSELGSVDDDLLYDMLQDVIYDMPDLFETLGWDDFELAAIAPTGLDDDGPDLPPSQGWQPPHLVSTENNPDTGKDEMKWDGDEETVNELVTQGATSAGVSGARNAVVQYTIVFDTPEQQNTWYSFLRWMKSKPDRYPGNTTSAMLTEFIKETIGNG